METVELWARGTGFPRSLRARLPAGLVSQVYLSGYWKEADTFAVRARWIETCFEKELTFQFAVDRCVVTEDEIVGGFLKRDVAPAIAVKSV